jgi:hypothetical protein
MLILLDIDGVMVTEPSWKPTEPLADGLPKFSSTAVNNLKKLISETKASIVLTSSHKSRFSTSQWEEIFKNRGIQATIEVLDKNIDDLDRKEEILNWYETHNNEDFVIIDDDKSLNDLPANIKHNLVLTRSFAGLDEEAYHAAADILAHSHPA